MKYLAPILNGIIIGLVCRAVGYKIHEWQYWAIFLPLLTWVILYRYIDNFFKNKYKNK